MDDDQSISAMISLLLSDACLSEKSVNNFKAINCNPTYYANEINLSLTNMANMFFFSMWK